MVIVDKKWGPVWRIFVEQAHIQAKEIFRRWYDLDVPERPEQRVTVFDDSVDVYRDEDLERLKSLSDVIALSDRRALVDLLAARLGNRRP